MDFIGALGTCGGGHNKMEWQAALLHSLHHGVFAYTGWTGNDDEQWLWVMEIKVGFRRFAWGHGRILPEPLKQSLLNYFVITLESGFLSIT